ncbi:transmembrane protein [methanogenic archaeon ISO4-H5]|nr:transmembrane protein [methanogenic archaeon ISO4-H5]
MIFECRRRLEDAYRSYPAVTTFVTISALALIVLILSTLVTHGQMLYWTLDFNPKSYLFGDHFDSVSTGVDDPYSKWLVIYPPFITSVYAFLGWLTSDFEDGTGINHAQALADSNLPVIVFIIFMIVSIYIFRRIMHRVLSESYSFSMTEWIFLAILFSIPVLYAIQRGNCIFYAIDCIMLFLLGYRSEKKAIRYLSYAAIIIAVNIKLYPALFMLLMLRERQGKEFLLCAAAALLLFFLPLYLYGSSPGAYLHHLFEYSSPTESCGSFIGMRQWIAGIGQEFFGSSLNMVGLVFCLAILAVSAMLILFDRDMPFWQMLTILGSNMAIGIGVSTLYGFLYLLPALIFLLAQYDRWDLETKYATVLLALIFASFPPVPVFKSVCTFVLLMLMLVLSIRRITVEKTRVEISVSS